MAKRKSRFSALTKYAVEQEAKKDCILCPSGKEHKEHLYNGKDSAKELAERIVFAIEGYTDKETITQIIYNQLIAVKEK